MIKKKIRLNEINKIKYYFSSKVQERKVMSKQLSKCIVTFDYIGKDFVAVSATSGGVSIISFASVIGTAAGIAS